MSGQLAPCSQCGSRAEENVKHNYVQCADKDCRFGMVGSANVSAAELWNRACLLAVKAALPR